MAKFGGAKSSTQSLMLAHEGFKGSSEAIRAPNNRVMMSYNHNDA